jgi:hypothetical protein
MVLGSNVHQQMNVLHCFLERRIPAVAANAKVCRTKNTGTFVHPRANVGISGRKFLYWISMPSSIALNDCCCNRLVMHVAATYLDVLHFALASL